ncbi:pyridoxamine 5'-phosphate oxidase [Isosphaeraceae bacterium EP7]
MQPEATSFRKDYTRHTLDERGVDADPIAQLGVWLEEAVLADVPEPNAMTLATATLDGHPSARIVLLRGLDRRGLTFYTNYDSRKGHELAANPHAAIVFFWPTQERQVRVEGRIDRAPAPESDAYFQSRPLASRLGAWASDQSQIIAGRDALEARYADLEKAHPDGDVPRPPHWGGYLLAPTAIEFWQGRASRLHDRLRYELDGEGRWSLQRLSP